MKKRLLDKWIYPDKNFYIMVISMVVPIACQNLITIAVNVTDTMMLGAIGEQELSASSLASQFVNIFQTFCMGTSMGASVLAARYWGMKEYNSLRKTITIMIRIIMVFAVLFAALTIFFPEQIMMMYTDDAGLIHSGVLYLAYMTPTYFLHGLSQTSTIIMRSMRKVKLPLIVSTGAFLLNIVGNYILIFGKFGMPAMGIAGAALSTLLVRIFECIFNFGYLVCVEKDVCFRFHHLFMKAGDLVPEYVRISIPVLVSDALMAFGSNVLVMIIGRLGSAFVAANAIAAVVERMSSAFSGGTSQASAAITGNTLGEGDKEKVQRQGYAFLGIGLALGMVAAVIILLISRPVVSAYHLSEETSAITMQLLRASAILIIVQSAANIMTKGVLRGGGDTKILMIADTGFLWAVSIPAGYLAGFVFGFSPFWIYICLKGENFCKIVWSIYRLKSGKWIKKIRTDSEVAAKQYSENKSILI